MQRILHIICLILFVATINELSGQSFLIEGPSIICPGQTYVLEPNRNFLKYKWSTADTSNIIFITKGGKYCVTVSDPLGIKDSACILVSEYNIEPVKIFGDTFLCQGSTAILEGNPGFLSYRWNDSINTRQIEINQAGKYCVQALNFNGCESKACITIHQKDWFYEYKEHTMCYGDTFIFNKFYLTEQGLNKFIFKKRNGCDSIYAINIFHYPKINFDTFKISKPSGFVVIPVISGGNAPLKYRWSNGDTTLILITALSGKYKLNVTDVNGCSRDTTINLFMTNNSHQTMDYLLSSIPNPLKGNEFLDYLHTSILQLPLYSFKCMDSAGRIIFTSDQKSKHIIANDFVNGIYFLQVISDGKLIYNKSILLIN